MFMQVSQIFQRRKSDANKQDFENKLNLTCQAQSILTKVFYIYGPNLVILAQRGDELSRGQARDWRTDGRRTDTQTDAGNDNARRPKLASGNKMKSKHPKKPVVHMRFDFAVWKAYTYQVSSLII